MVPESAILGDETDAPLTAAAGPPSPATRDAPDKAKRKAAPPLSGARSSSRERGARKKARRAPAAAAPWLVEDVSPTLLTWVASAAVVVLVSALSFSAGYVVGRESARADAAAGFARGGAAACGRDGAGAQGGNGWRRLRWSGATASVRA